LEAFEALMRLGLVPGPALASDLVVLSPMQAQPTRAVVVVQIKALLLSRSGLPHSHRRRGWDLVGVCHPGRWKKKKRRCRSTGWDLQWQWHRH